MQDVPGSFPIRASVEQERPDETACLSLTEAVHVRRAEYVRPKHVRIKIGTWSRLFGHIRSLIYHQDHDLIA